MAVLFQINLAKNTKKNTWVLSDKIKNIRNIVRWKTTGGVALIISSSTLKTLGSVRNGLKGLSIQN